MFSEIYTRTSTTMKMFCFRFLRRIFRIYVYVLSPFFLGLVYLPNYRGMNSIWNSCIYITVFMSLLKLHNTCRYQLDRAKLWHRLSGHKKFTFWFLLTRFISKDLFVRFPFISLSSFYGSVNQFNWVWDFYIFIENFFGRALYQICHKIINRLGDLNLSGETEALLCLKCLNYL